MKRSKKILLLPLALFLLCFALTACKDAAEPSANSSSGTDEVTSLRLQLDYYESRVAELESELTAAKVQLYLQRSAYEKKLLAIESNATFSDPEPAEATFEPEAPEPSPIWFHEARADGIVITGVSIVSDRLELPETLDGLPVVAIGENAFANCACFSVILPDTIKEIGWFAFSGCSNLVRVSIPASVEKIGYAAFENCSKSLQIFCKEDSYAAAYARSYGISVKTD